MRLEDFYYRGTVSKFWKTAFRGGYRSKKGRLVMRKKWCLFKFCLLSISLIGVTVAGHHYYNFQMNAAPANFQYYQAGDSIERTNTQYFKINGIKWKFIYSDNTRNQGYIVSESLINKFTCPNQISASDGIMTALRGNADNCFAKIQSDYSSNDTKDITGKLIESINPSIDFSTLRLMTLAEYNEISRNDTDTAVLKSIRNGGVWLEDRKSVV